MNRAKILEIVFWVSMVLIFSPRIILKYYEKSLETNLIQNNWNNHWQLFDQAGNSLVSNLTLPHDLRVEEEKTTRRHWIFKKTIDSNDFHKFNRPTIVLGKIGDSDRFFINDCLTGSTGLTLSNRPLGWWWSVLRVYEVPRECIPKNDSQVTELTIHVFKWNTSGYGIFGGPIGIGEFEVISRITTVIDWLHHFTLAFFGITMFLSGLYYIFVYVLLPSKHHYGIFALTTLSISIFEFFTSTLPFRVANDGETMLRILFTSAVATASLILGFFYSRFRAVELWLLLVSIGGGVVALLVGLTRKGLGMAYPIYELWQAFFLLTFAIAFIQICRFWWRSNIADVWRYLFGFTALMLACLHDVYITRVGAASSYLVPYGFICLAGAVALALAKEYSDSLLYVEEQVENRTRDLALTLEQLKASEKMREEMVNIVLSENSQVAHDIRSPLAALDVALQSIESVEETRKNLIQTSLARIKNISENLLDRNKVLSGLKNNVLALNHHIDHQPCILYPYIESVIAEQHIRLTKLPSIKLKTAYPKNILSACVKVNPFEIARVLSNIINNSIQSLNGQGVVRVKIIISKETIEIRILDNGHGIPKDILSSIGTLGFSHGKKGGSGLGVHHAIKTMKECGGNFIILSTVNRGTLIRLKLPRIALPSVFVSTLQFPLGTNLIIVDDESVIHKMWDHRFQSVSLHSKIKSLLHFSTLVELVNYVKTRTEDELHETRFLVDYQFNNSQETGLEIIQKLGISSKSTLVTGLSNDLSLHDRCVTAGVGILPKTLISVIPIEPS